MNLIETAKKTLVNFESSQNCVINLKDVEPKYNQRRKRNERE